MDLSHIKRVLWLGKKHLQLTKLFIMEYTGILELLLALSISSYIQPIIVFNQLNKSIINRKPVSISLYFVSLKEIFQIGLVIEPLLDDICLFKRFRRTNQHFPFMACLGTSCKNELLHVSCTRDCNWILLQSNQVFSYMMIMLTIALMTTLLDGQSL